MLVRKRRLEGSLVLADGIVQIKVEYTGVDVVLLPVEGGKLEWITE